MTLSHLSRNRTIAVGTSPNSNPRRSKRRIRLATASAAAALVSIGGFLATDVVAQHDDSCFPINQNTRSIQMIESKEAPVASADDDSLPDFVIDPNRRSILLIEGKEAPLELAQPSS